MSLFVGDLLGNHLKTDPLSEHAVWSWASRRWDACVHTPISVGVEELRQMKGRPESFHLPGFLHGGLRATTISSSWHIICQTTGGCLPKDEAR